MFDSSVFLHSSPKKKKNIRTVNMELARHYFGMLTEMSYRDVFITQSNIDELFCEISYWVKAVDYFLYKAPSMTFENALNSYVLN